MACKFGALVENCLRICTPASHVECNCWAEETRNVARPLKIKPETATIGISDWGTHTGCVVLLFMMTIVIKVVLHSALYARLSFMH